MKDDTSHQRHSKLLYIIFLHLWNVIHTKSYPTRHAGLWRIQLLQYYWNYHQLRRLRSNLHRNHRHVLAAEHDHLETAGPVELAVHKDSDVALVQQTATDEVHREE